ncbi:MAG: hypothetical protein IJX20_01150, partial [Alphaproteobacteria bacterium]|nr:hypothetical protein [Alphaproteobacteria bacterium]
CPNGLALYKYCTCPSNYQYSCSSGNNITGGNGTVCNGKYTACTCSSPFIWNNGSCICPDTYVYACSGTGYSSGSGVGCNKNYTSCNCATNYVWNGSACVCDSSFKYACSGTGYNSGSGASCGGKYKSCNCSAYYTWNGSACKHTHSYTCPSGSYASSSSCAYGTSGTVSKACACGATSGTCYYCTTCTSSSSDYCWVHDTCHGDCCSDGTYEPCEEICGGSGCYTPPSSSSSGGGSSTPAESKYGIWVGNYSCVNTTQCSGSKPWAVTQSVDVYCSDGTFICTRNGYRSSDTCWTTKAECEANYLSALKFVGGERYNNQTGSCSQCSYY